MSNKKRGLGSALALVSMCLGAGVAWGVGGYFFAFGLWLLLCTMTEYLERP